ncbi:hypothetical protein WG901_09770 [Novosphingobium sp. PS1R-30]|uniref:SH3 domain-containing protein n=1 Tax=Novosphingobium anseongense TaxID=3133436 RepID=A0ABU8RVA0_9SPHN|nr:MAG: hypothetical protein EOO76_12560 [Novosphingobium sp.]
MRRCAAILLAAVLLCRVTSAEAAEKGQILRAGDLLAQPFIDAAKSGPVTANQPVTILERRGAWASVEAGSTKGWVRLLNLRLEAGAARPGATRPGGIASLRTGSSGRTATTGIKGMDEEDIRNATPDYQELELLGTLAVTADDARATAQKAALKENTVAYLDKGRSRK